MNIDRSMKFAVALLMLISGFTALISEGIGEVDAAEAVYYHNSFIHFNVNLHNGTPAVGYYAYWVCRFEYTSVSKLVDAQGDATLNLTFNKLGHGIIRVRDPSHKLCYDEETFIGMDETLYRNITLPPPSEPYNLITGTLKYADTQLPVPGEKITISATDDIGEGLVAYLSTNSEGRYEAYLPNITKNPVYVSCSSINGYRSVARSLYLKEGIHTYTVDLEANIWMKGDLDSRLRFIDAGNGEPLSGALVMESTAADSVLSYYDTMIKTRGPDGWYNFSGSRGELKIYYYMTDFHGWNGFNIITQVLHNDTAMDIEILADPSFLVPVRIDVWNGTHPLSGARARASLEGAGDFGQFSCYYDNMTDMNGTMTAYLPYGRKISFQVSAPDHVTLTAYVDTRGSGPYGANLTLVPVVDPVPSTTSVSVTLVDDETDMIVPDGKVYLYMRYNDHNYGFSGTTDANGKYTATVNVGTYYSIIGVCNLGTGTLTDHVITETGPNDITIRMERYSYPPTIWADDHHFIVRDLDGEAVPGATVRVQSYFNSRSWTSYEFVSDPLGRVDIKAVPGMEVTISTDMVTESGSLNPWAMQRTVIVPQAGVPDMGGVTLYPRPAHS